MRYSSLGIIGYRVSNKIPLVSNQGEIEVGSEGRFNLIEDRDLGRVVKRQRANWI